MTFTIIDGTEQYKVTDLTTDGVSFFQEKLEAYRYAYILVAKLGHEYQIEDRKNNWVSRGGK